MKTRLEMKTAIETSGDKSSTLLLFRPPKPSSQTDNTTVNTTANKRVCSIFPRHLTMKQTFLNMAGFGREGPKKGTSSRAVTET